MGEPHGVWQGTEGAGPVTLQTVTLLSAMLCFVLTHLSLCPLTPTLSLL